MLRPDGRLLAAAGAVSAAAGVYLYLRRHRRSQPAQMIHYDEFGLFRDNCTEHGLAYEGRPTVVRESVVLSDGQSVSALRGRGSFLRGVADGRSRCQRADSGLKFRVV